MLGFCVIPFLAVPLAASLKSICGMVGAYAVRQRDAAELSGGWMDSTLNLDIAGLLHLVVETIGFVYMRHVLSARTWAILFHNSVF